MTKPRTKGHFGHCDTHDKRIYTDRSSAREAIRRLQGGGMRAYRCDVVDGMWHIGHLAPEIRQGRTTADAYYGGLPTPTNEETNR